MTVWRVPLAIASAVLLTSTAVAAEDSASKYAEELAELRKDVETLSGEIETKKDELRSRLRALESQKADIEAQIRREEIRLAQVQRRVEEQKEEARRTNEAGEVLRPVLEQAITKQKAKIREGLPYRIEDRIADLEKLENQLKEGTLRPQKAASRLWQYVEDELRLTRENIIDRQVIELEGKEVMVDIGRLGMVSAFFKSPDGRVGYAERAGDGWTWKVESNAAQIERIEGLFDALSKQIRVGWFEIPAVLPEAK